MAESNIKRYVGRRDRTIFHVSDLHFGKYSDAGPDQGKFSEYVTAFVNSMGMIADYLIISGDLTSASNKHNETEYQQFLRWVSKVTPLFKCVLVVPGNHDNTWLKFAKTAKKVLYDGFVDKHERCRDFLLKEKLIIHPWSIKCLSPNIILIPNKKTINLLYPCRIVYDKQARIGFMLVSSAKMSGEITDELKRLLLKEWKEKELKSLIDTGDRDRLDIGAFDDKYIELMSKTWSDFEKAYPEIQHQLRFLVMHHPVSSHAGEGYPAVEGFSDLNKAVSGKCRYALHGHIHKWIPKGKVKETEGEFTPLAVGTLSGQPRDKKKLNGFNIIMVGYNEQTPFIKAVYRIPFRKSGKHRKLSLSENNLIYKKQ